MDTAQPLAAETVAARIPLLSTSMMTPAERARGRFMRAPDGHEGGDPVAAAAEAFKSYDPNPTPEQPRDAVGRFASTEQAEEPNTEAAEIEGSGPEAEPAEEVADTDAAEGAAEEAQQSEAVEMPASWDKDRSDEWNALSPETQAYVAQREGQRDAAVNVKFQEAANVRKAAEAAQTEATAARDAYAQTLDQLIAWMQPTAPQPEQYVTSEGFDVASFTLAKNQYEQQAGAVAELQQQRQQIAAQREADEVKAHQAAWAEGAPKLFSSVPDLADQSKAPAIIADLDRFAIAEGIPPGSLSHATPVEVSILWKAMQYDRQQEAAQRVKAQARPQPKPAAPSVRPGASKPGSAVRRTQADAVMERLRKSGSIEDGAAAFKLFTKAR